MKTRIALAAAFLAVLPPLAKADAPASGNASVDIQFQDKEKFTDVKSSSMATEKDRDALLSEIQEFVTTRVTSRLPAGHKVEVIFRDIDMAGDFEPWRFEARDVRIVKDVYPPRIKLKFKVTDASGAVVKEGDRSLSDLSFMMRLTIDRSDLLRFEKSLLSDWISDDFPKQKKS